MKLAHLCCLTLSLGLNAACGAQPHGAVPVAAPDAQAAHTDGLMSAFAGRVGVKQGIWVLELVHQGLFTQAVTLTQVSVVTGDAPVETPLFLGADHQIYGAWPKALLPGPAQYYALGAFAGTPTVGKPLRFQLVAGARLTFEKAHDDRLTGLHLPDTASLKPLGAPRPLDSTPVLVKND